MSQYSPDTRSVSRAQNRLVLASENIYTFFSKYSLDLDLDTMIDTYLAPIAGEIVTRELILAMRRLTNSGTSAVNQVLVSLRP